MSYATLLHGEPADVIEALENDTDIDRLRMALSNAFLRIKRLESRLATDAQIDAAIYAQCPDFDAAHDGPSIDDVRAIVRRVCVA